MATNQKEKVLIGDEKVKGFRKGVTKRSLVQSMDDEDWKRLDDIKRAQELKVENEHAHRYWVEADQLKQEFYKKKIEAEEILLNIELRERKVNQIRVEIEKSSDELEKINYELDIATLTTEARKAMSTLNVYLFNLYVFVGRTGFDDNVIFTEDQYESIVKAAMARLEKISFKL